MASEASIPACPRCGAPIAVDFEAPSIRCRHCSAARARNELDGLLGSLDDRACAPALDGNWS
ncbi:MAG: hypothetical protein HOW73_02720 [Polyangiaceae bacterium]|nr:hypothetical protein [Polyangiaceae bacterium]